MTSGPLATRPPLAPVPSLEELGANPTRATQLPVEVTETLLAEVHARQGQLHIVAGALLGRLLVLRPAGRLSFDEDRAVGIEEAAAITGMKPATLRRREKWQQLGGYRDLDGHIKFSWRKLQRRVAR